MLTSLPKPTRTWLLMLCAVLMALRITPLVMHGAAGFGYDTGFYRGFLLSHITPPDAGAPLLTDEAVAVRLLLRALSYFPLPVDVTLFGSYILLSLPLALLVFLLARQLFGSDRAGLIALLIFALSPTQWTVHVFMLYKQAFAMPLVLGALSLAGAGSALFLIPFAVTAVSHRTSVLLMAPALTLHALYVVIKKRSVIALSAVCVISIIALRLNADALQQLTALAFGVPPTLDIFRVATGDFMNLGSYARVSLPYAALAIYGAYLLVKRRTAGVFLLFTLSVLIPVIFRAPFHQRMIAYLDLALIILAGGGLHCILERITAPRKVAVALAAYGAVLALFIGSTIFSYQPVISDALRTEAFMLGDTEMNALLMTDARAYGSLLYGWSGPDKRVVSPGLLWDRWQPAQWYAFWSGDTRIQTELLSTFGEPIYLLSTEADFGTDPCFRKLGNYSWKFVCP